MKSIRTQSFSCLCFPAFGLSREIYSTNLCIQSRCGKIRTRKNMNTDTFYAVFIFYYSPISNCLKMLHWHGTKWDWTICDENQAMDCAFGMNQCTAVDYEVNVLGLHFKATQAMCTSTALNCQICPVIKKCFVEYLKMWCKFH